jgi:hypothetical protein
MKPAAFTRTPAGLFKVYDHGPDFQIIGPNFERWSSAWTADRAASLKRAAALIPDADPAAIVYTTEEPTT